MLEKELEKPLQVEGRKPVGAELLADLKSTLEQVLLKEQAGLEEGSKQIRREGRDSRREELECLDLKKLQEEKQDRAEGEKNALAETKATKKDENAWRSKKAQKKKSSKTKTSLS